MRRFRSRRFAMLLILMLTLSMVFQGVAPVAFAEATPAGDGLGVEIESSDVSDQTVRPDITVNKTVNGAWPSGGFEFTLQYWDNNHWAKSSVSPNPIYLTEGSSTGVFLDRTYDEYYRVVETPVAGYQTTIPLFNGNDYFKLRSDVTANFTNTQLGKITVNKTIGEGYEGNKRVCFTLSIAPEEEPVLEIDAQHRDRFPQEICQFIEGESGTFAFENLPWGRYILQETSMPRFYKSDLDSGQVIEINADNLMPEINVNNTFENPIQIEKTVTPEIASVGDVVTYVFTVKNIGDYNLYHVQLHDLNIPFDGYLDAGDNPEATVILPEFLTPGEEWTLSTTHTMTASDLAGGSFINSAEVKAYTCMRLPKDNEIGSQCYELCIWVTDSDDATVTLPAPIPETPTTTTITTVERDRAEPAGSFIPAEPVPLAAPVIIPAPVVLPEEIIPLGVPVLPKTGELPMELFYGLGGMLTALGAYLKRK